MEISEIVNLCLIVLCSIGLGVMIFLKVRGNLFAAVSELIAIAETTGLPGAMKMNKVVQALRELVPAPLKSVFTAERLEKIAQHVFDWMRKYADEYKDNLDQNIKSDQEQNSSALEGDTVGRAAAAELIADLLTMTLAELKEKTEEELGVTLEGNIKKREYIKLIVEAILKRV